ncbi:hypothetical protein HJG60_009462 [Phyllostomus discolor]|uniref:Uncharacterized protein n=1 Tax=Phyllostomus discolor TaxID=89673 RepID=A0A834DCI7_9CHIR|nr:hypothetical protein HJG60_009462 [Phyllostomus discolor]
MTRQDPPVCGLQETRLRWEHVPTGSEGRETIHRTGNKGKTETGEAPPAPDKIDFKTKAVTGDKDGPGSCPSLHLPKETQSTKAKRHRLVHTVPAASGAAATMRTVCPNCPLEAGRQGSGARSYAVERDSATKGRCSCRWDGGCCAE